MSAETPQSGGESPEQPVAAPATAAPPAAEVAAIAPEPAVAPDATDVAAAAAAMAPEPSIAPAAATAPATEDPFGGMSQASIDELLRQASFADPTPAEPPAMPSRSAAPAPRLPDSR